MPSSVKKSVKTSGIIVTVSVMFAVCTPAFCSAIGSASAKDRKSGCSICRNCVGWVISISPVFVTAKALTLHKLISMDTTHSMDIMRFFTVLFFLG